MIMTHICTCVLFVLMCGTSDAAFTATLPTGNNMGVALTPYVKYNQIRFGAPGNGYNPLTGIFTVPIGMRGTYLVSVTMMTGNVVAGHAQITKNADTYVWLYTGNQFDMATQTVCMELEVADTVAVTTTATILFDVYNTFTAVRVLG